MYLPKTKQELVVWLLEHPEPSMVNALANSKNYHNTFPVHEELLEYTKELFLDDPDSLSVETFTEHGREYMSVQFHGHEIYRVREGGYWITGLRVTRELEQMANRIIAHEHKSS